VETVCAVFCVLYVYGLMRTVDVLQRCVTVATFAQFLIQLNDVILLIQFCQLTNDENRQDTAEQQTRQPTAKLQPAKSAREQQAKGDG
jgi:hypothetical protein